MYDLALTLACMAIGFFAATPAARTVKICVEPHPNIKFIQVVLVVTFPFLVMAVAAGFVMVAAPAQLFSCVLGMVSVFILRILYACIAPWLPR